MSVQNLIRKMQATNSYRTVHLKTDAQSARRREAEHGSPEDEGRYLERWLDRDQYRAFG
jgi:hypothetical protein